VATSPKRYGLDVKNNLELELRLRRIEGEIERRALANDFGDTSDATQRVTNIPPVSGLRVVGKTPSAVSLAWNQVRISDLRRYELWIAEDLAFSSNLQKFNVASTEFQYSTVAEEGGGGLTTVYAKVRARNRSGNVGPFSVVLNAETGQAQTDDIADDAITPEKIDLEEGSVVFDNLDDSDVGSQLALRGFIDGLILSRNSGDNQILDVAAGVARDSTNVLSMSLTSTFTKRIDTGWASGDGNGGLASLLTATANTWYHVFQVSSGAGNADIGFDTDVDASNLLAEGSITYYRRIGSVYTDGSIDITEFFQIGEEFFWLSPATDATLTISSSEQSTTFNGTKSGGAIPPDVRVKANFNMYLKPNGGGNNFATRLYDPTHPESSPVYGPSGSGWVANIVYNASDNDHVAQQTEIWSNTSQQIAYDSDSIRASPRIYLSVNGWQDPRGQNNL
jgi:hypothetical protein